MSLISIFPLLVEVEIILFLRVASLFVPVTHQSFSFELAGVIRGLLNYEVTIHLLKLQIFY